MKVQKKFRIVLVMTLALFIASCGSKQNQAGQTDAAESTDSTKVDSVDAVVEGQYDFEAFQGVFSYAGDFSEGLAAVRTPGNSEESINSHSGYIDSSGKMVIELPDGWWGRKFMDGVAQIQKMDSCYIIDKTGQRLFKVNNEAIYTGDDIIYSDGLAVVYGKGKYEKKRGFMDKTGRITFCLIELIKQMEGME